MLTSGGGSSGADPGRTHIETSGVIIVGINVVEVVVNLDFEIGAVDSCSDNSSDSSSDSS